jgi:CheY-like chemotaxis protein
VSASPIRVLLVDDNADVRLIMKLALDMAGFSAVTAANAAEVLMIQSMRPADILVADIAVLASGEFQTIEGFRRAYPRTKIVAIAGDARSAQKDHRLAATLASVDATVRKPVDPKELIGILRSLTGG